jgi:alkylation response protein AidB-like acyl-CoA dehydrogenase
MVLRAGAVPRLDDAAVALVESGDAAARRMAARIASGDALVTFALGEGLGQWDAAQLVSRVTAGSSRARSRSCRTATWPTRSSSRRRTRTVPGCGSSVAAPAGVSHTTLRVFDMTRRVTMATFAGAPAAKIATGRAAIDRARDAGLVLVAADAFGGAARCLDMTARYSLTREQFGQPIAAFQGVKHQLADLACDLEPSRSLWWYAAHAFDHLPERSERHAALAKAHLTDVYDRVGRYAIELHGASGSRGSSTSTSGGVGRCSTARSREPPGIASGRGAGRMVTPRG